MERLSREQAAPLTAAQFADLNGLRLRFIGQVSSILGGKLVGVYLTGSFALGGGDAASDCDFLTVTDSDLGREEESALRRLHEEIPNWPSYWAYNLEGSYAPK